MLTFFIGSTVVSLLWNLAQYWEKKQLACTLNYYRVKAEGKAKTPKLRVVA